MVPTYGDDAVCALLENSSYTGVYTGGRSPIVQTTGETGQEEGSNQCEFWFLWGVSVLSPHVCKVDYLFAPVGVTQAGEEGQNTLHLDVF